VHAPTHEELDLVNPDAVDAWFVAHNVDVVLHGAVRPGHRNAKDPSRQLWTNLRMFHCLTRNSNRYGRLVFLSSGAVYDICQPLHRVREDELGRSLPEDDHGLSKYTIARYIESAHKAAIADVIELRLFGVFGKYEDYAIRFISNAICKTIAGLPITLRQNRTFSYLYVDDLGPIVKRFLTAPHAYSAYNVVPDWTDDLVDLARLVQARGTTDGMIRVGTAGTGLPYSGSNARLRAEMPDVRFTPVADAIDALYAWYASSIATIDRSALLVDK
jgi:UDP-glucose 4-epimerase